MASTSSVGTRRRAKELWRKTGSTQQNLNAAAYGVRPLAQSSQTGDFISTSGDPLGRIAFGRGRISLTNNLTGESQIITKQINHGIRSLDVSPDGTLIAAGDAKGLVVFDRTETVVYTKTQHSGNIPFASSAATTGSCLAATSAMRGFHRTENFLRW